MVENRNRMELEMNVQDGRNSMRSHTVRRRMKAIVADIAALEPCGPFTLFLLSSCLPPPLPSFRNDIPFHRIRLLPVQRLPPVGPRE